MAFVDAPLVEDSTLSNGMSIAIHRPLGAVSRGLPLVRAQIHSHIVDLNTKITLLIGSVPVLNFIEINSSAGDNPIVIFSSKILIKEKSR